MGYCDLERRKCERTCFCRNCDKEMVKGTEVIYTYSMRNRGQNIFFCLDCAKLIGELANEPEDNS